MLNYYKRIVTPEEAKELLLKHNISNRKVSERNVRYLLKEMNSGNWMETGETIKISETGKMLNGQHQLLALIMYGKPLELWFCEGLKDKVMEVLDTGKKRTSGDVLSMSGFKFANELAATIRIIKDIKDGTILQKNKISTSEVLDFCQKNEELQEIVQWVASEQKKFRMIPTSGISALYYHFSLSSQKHCEDFWDMYYSGLNIDKNHPVYHLRNKLIQDKTNKSKLHLNTKLAYIVAAWNSYRKSASIQKLEIATDKFPKILTGFLDSFLKENFVSHLNIYNYERINWNVIRVYARGYDH